MSAVSGNIQQRYEQKFVFKQRPPVYVERIVKDHPADFHEIFKQRQINNIYLDTPELKFYSDHKTGNTNRKKIRIRWYGNTFGHVPHPVLEFKSRQGELRIKKSYPLPEFNIEKGFDSAQIKEILAMANLPSEVLDETEELEARLMNSYSRRYYRSVDYHYRLTIDRKLEYFKVFRRENLFLHKEIDVTNVILELKFAVEFASEAHNIYNELPTQDYDFSKYISGVEKLNSHQI